MARILVTDDSSFPVIVLTADIQDTVQQECMALGAFGFLNKPPKPDEIPATLNAALAAAEARS